MCYFMNSHMYYLRKCTQKISKIILIFYIIERAPKRAITTKKKLTNRMTKRAMIRLGVLHLLISTTRKSTNQDKKKRVLLKLIHELPTVSIMPLHHHPLNGVLLLPLILPIMAKIPLNRTTRIQEFVFVKIYL